MNHELRSKLAEYIASAIRYSVKNFGANWPEETILIVKSYEEFAELDEIVGMKVYIMDMPNSYPFFPAFPAKYSHAAKLQRYFLEYIDTHNIDY